MCSEKTTMNITTQARSWRKRKWLKIASDQKVDETYVRRCSSFSCFHTDFQVQESEDMVLREAYSRSKIIARWQLRASPKAKIFSILFLSSHCIKAARKISLIRPRHWGYEAETNSLENHQYCGMPIDYGHDGLTLNFSLQDFDAMKEHFRNSLTKNAYGYDRTNVGENHRDRSK